MAFETFHFKDFTGFGTPKLWSRRGIDDEDESLALFSSVETDETTVRSDMQMLFSQLKAGLNKILGHVTNAIDAVRKSEETLVTEKAVVDYMTELGNGDMAHSVYDADEAVKDAGGIKAFVNSSAGAAIATHAANATIHVTAAERTTWNSKANGVHTHDIEDITGLQSELDSKSDTDHTHESFDNGLEVNGDIGCDNLTADITVTNELRIMRTPDDTQQNAGTNVRYVNMAIDSAVCKGVNYGEVTLEKTEHDLQLTARHTGVGFYTVVSGALFGVTIPLCALNADSFTTFAVSTGGSSGTWYTVEAKLNGRTLTLKRSAGTRTFYVYGF